MKLSIFERDAEVQITAALAFSYLHYSVVRRVAPSLLGRCKQKQRGVRGYYAVMGSS